MARTAKLFKNGRSQAVRLPAEYRFNCKEVYIRQDPDTGDLIISRTPGSWQDFFKLVHSAGIPQDFMTERNDTMPQKRELF
jgi:antitoxin VapB